MEPGTLTRVLTDFFTTEVGELSLRKGDYFLIEEVINKYWCYGRCHNQFGKFPTDHLLEVELPNVKCTESLYISIVSFQGDQIGDLSFNKGEIIIGNPVASSGWLNGYIGARKGIFPASCTWELNDNLMKNVQPQVVKREAKVKTSLKAQLKGELDLVQGETIIVTEILKDAWCVGYKENGETGTFPESFITYLEVENVDKTSTSIELLHNKNMSASSISEKIYDSNHLNFFQSKNEEPESDYNIFFNSKITKNHSLSDIHSIRPYAITLFRFDAQFPNELSFEAGQVINIIKYVDNEWGEGTIGLMKGIFPLSYVNIIVDCFEYQNENQSQDETFQVDDTITLNDEVKVKYSFDAQIIGDLNVSEGEIVTVVGITNNEWVTVKNINDEIGFCPKAYLTTDLNSKTNFDELENKDFSINQIEQIKLSEPHRPAPPAPLLESVPTQNYDQRKTFYGEIHKSFTKKKKTDQRQKVISELYLTEKDYIRDLKLTFETFNLQDPGLLESKGIDVSILFGNISEIIEIAELLLDLIQKAIKDCDENFQIIGSCFLSVSEKMRVVYGKYCSNHELSLLLLQKYEGDKEVMKIFEKGVETLRLQVTCFDMNSLLIKPVQRILKYPLILNELNKFTENDHPDKAKIEEASKVMANVASYINEYKRKKELAFKYLHSNNTFIGKMANLSIHSVAKKSSRLSAKLSVSLGLTNLPTDTKFDELVKIFFSLEKYTKQFLKDVEHSMNYLDDETFCGEILTEQLYQYFTGTLNGEINQIREIRNVMRFHLLKELKACIESQVILPLNILISFLLGPELLIHKRHDKMLDYDSAISRNEKSKEKEMIQDDVTTAKSNFEALNQQLLEELPIFIKTSTIILHSCIAAFTNARKLYTGKTMRKYLITIEAADQVSLENIIESFLIHHMLLYNQISRLSYGGIHARIDESSLDLYLQPEVYKNAVKAKYPTNKLYIVSSSVSGTTVHDLSATKGTIVGIIKTQDPMGNTSKWFVDNGSVKGFINKQYLRPCNEARCIENSLNCNEVDAIDLMNLGSPILKTIHSDLVTHIKDKYEKQNTNRNCDSIVDPEIKRESENALEEFVYALFDFHQPLIPGTLSVKQGQALKVLVKHDEKNNVEWWLLKDKTGKIGYVPRNHLKNK